MNGIDELDGSLRRTVTQGQDGQSDETVNPTSYCCVNTAVPILQFYLDQAADHRAHLRLSLPSIRSLIAAVSLESEHGWDKDIKVLVFLHWLAHAASYKVLSQAFDMPISSVHGIVHKAITDHHRKFLDVFVGYLGEPVQNPVLARFNSKHSRARSIVERAFGMMKARWRSLFFKALEVSPVFVPEVVACCAVLHNLALLNGDIVKPVEEDHDDGPPQPHNLEPRGGEHVRNNLAAAVSTPIICVPAFHEHDYL
ncbi:Protein ANTAGONIST OF LIKE HETEROCHROMATIN PROTEIN 1 [Labeo rohita]|uniref:Protein ANTAGONIST OF LIKE HETEROCHROMATIN PROTEIN 1 n=1 Tax=Labeo rohita TaxID=84645 RepID=A0ABQ8L3H4_LABRO|nr:Protein ANTAGONIST OF LIKE HETEROCHROMATIN PROTEIN 1 [Labeo rohita]